MRLNPSWMERRMWLARGRALVGLTLLLAAVPVRAAQVLLVADAHVNSARPTANSGSISNLNVGGGYTALLQFGLGMLPAGTTAAQVTRAVLLVYCNRVNVAGSVSVQAVNGAWGEYSVTYATLPSLAAAAQTMTVSTAGAFVAVDVTALVQGWVTTPASNNGLALTASTANLQFDSKENDQTGHAAVLDVSIAGSGPAGPAGAPGATGPAGPVGPAGVPGVKGDPGAAGPAGVAGPAGPQGAAGIAGPAGVAGTQGPAGATGRPGLVYQGGYLAATSYALGDVVVWQGSSYASLIAGNHGNTPGLVPSAWGMLTAQGPAGVAGPAGAIGPAGPTGATGSPGATGPAGPAGPQGAAGAVGVRYRGSWSAGLPYAVGDAVSFAGSTYLAQITNSAEQPNLYPLTWAVMAQAGATGPSGPTGSAATLSVGTVTTGAAGSPAMVSNSGTNSAAVLNFTIPQGATGAGGGVGAPGGVDVSAASVYHAVSNSFLYYSVTSGNFSGGSDTAQVLTWVPNGCTATRLMVYSQQGQTITVRLRHGLPGAMNDTALACVVAANSSCIATGSIAVGAGSFIDLSALGATGTPSPVWTALSCN